MVEAPDASGSTAATEGGALSADGHRMVSLRFLQGMMIERLSERSQVLREIQERCARESMESLPEEVLNHLQAWTLSIVRLDVDMLATDDDTIIRDLTVCCKLCLLRRHLLRVVAHTHVESSM